MFPGPRCLRDLYEAAPHDPGTLAVIGSVVSIASGAKSLFGGGSSSSAALPEPPPAPEPDPVLPTPNDAAVTAAKRRQIAARTQQTGRASTILSDPTGRALGA